MVSSKWGRDNCIFAKKKEIGFLLHNKIIVITSGITNT